MRLLQAGRVIIVRHTPKVFIIQSHLFTARMWQVGAKAAPQFVLALCLRGNKAFLSYLLELYRMWIGEYRQQQCLVERTTQRTCAPHPITVFLLPGRSIRTLIYDLPAGH